MPLIIHPSSQCDVCWGSYTCESADDSPHAIQCGHVFCRTCIVNLSPADPHSSTPPICPLCRLVFTRDGANKLHVGLPTGTEVSGTGVNIGAGTSTSQSSNSAQMSLLKELAVSWEKHPIEVEILLDEVEEWLASNSGEVAIPVRSARDALIEYHRLKLVEAEKVDSLFDNEFVFRQQTSSPLGGDDTSDEETRIAMEESLLSARRQSEPVLALEEDTRQAIEASLRSEVQSLQMEVEKQKTEVERLRRELEHSKRTSSHLLGYLFA
ncbi:hypothetical protein BDQ12DRAFT_687136 [Crucibulum laeve]|uniref:RING-type domain-containing protein n=1 Tax=Crucibulum laeve TaxID=68775 RepID=A0A5C3LWI0_9AGAR|nr:hypothetical protein BDQ12DRAFT_687136 [Crucibulum laeve]